MKKMKFLLSAALAFTGFVAVAQDLSGEAYAMWGATVEERQENILKNSFLKESLQNRDYNAAAGFFNELVAKVPSAAESIYQRGEQIYINKFSRAKTRAEQMQAFDSMMVVYDLRLQYFGQTPESKAKILDRRARQYAKFNKKDREGLREAFQMAIAADVEGQNPDLYETIVHYFNNLCEDYANDEVYPDTVIAEYDRLSPLFDAYTPGADADYRAQFETLFGTSGVASCENLEALFAKKLAADPDNLDVLNQAVALMSRAKCTSDFFFEVTERQYKQAPSANTAIYLAQAFQDKGDFAKATSYLREALKAETDEESRENLLVQLGMVELAQSHVAAAREVANELREINAENGYSYFILAQCYAASGCQEAFWAAYDTMKQAEERFDDDTLKEKAHALAAAYAGRWPQANDEKFFMEGITAGSSYTITCGAAAGVRTTVRFR